MDPSTILGIVLAFGAIFAMLLLDGASPLMIFLPAPMVFVFGATFASSLASGPLRDTVNSLKALPKSLLGKRPQYHERIDSLVELARVARAKGLLALESHAQEEADHFLGSGLQSMADGIDGEALREQLENSIDTKAAADKIPARFFTNMGAYAPTIGVIGTVVALTQALENLTDPEALGPMIAAAFVATLWGLVSSNLMWLPIGAKLQRLSEMEVQHMTITMEGLLAIQEGAQPLMLGDRLRAMLPSDIPARPDLESKDAPADEVSTERSS